MITILIAIMSFSFGNQIRTINLKPEAVGLINTTVHFSTFIHLSQKPVDVATGDQGLFKIQYVNNGISVRPYTQAAKTNLFIFTENDCFVFLLKAGSEANADFKIEARRVFEDPAAVKSLNSSGSGSSFALKLISITGTKDKQFLDFELTNKGSKSQEIEPAGFRIVQNSIALELKSVFLEKIALPAHSTAKGTFLLPQFQPNTKAEIWILPRGGSPLNIMVAPPSVKAKGGKNEF